MQKQDCCFKYLNGSKHLPSCKILLNDKQHHMHKNARKATIQMYLVSLTGSMVDAISGPKIYKDKHCPQFRVKGLEDPIVNWIDSKNSTGARTNFSCRKIQLNFQYTLHCYPVLLKDFF